MAANQFIHTDNDGERLQVDQGIYSAVFTTSGDGGFVQVAVRKAHLPALIATLQAIEAEVEQS